MSIRQLDLDGTPAWLRDMNPEQVLAINHQDGPCALLAQAGSGKTRALVHRIQRMVAQGTDPALILAVTFSKKAADEMNDRLEDLGVEGARVGTWHSLCLQILKEDRTRWSEWTMGDKADGAAKQLVKEVLGYKHMDWKQADPAKVTRFIGWCKAHLALPEDEFAEEAARDQFGGSWSRAVEAYALYHVFLEERGLLTYDDFLMFAHQHLSIEENRLKWASRWTHILQDEAQDASLVQVSIAEMLARDHRNYLVVGDVAQSIFGFRGSSPSYLHEFAATWRATTIVMNRNYRSGRAIVDVANKVIAPAEIRLPTDMLAERGTEGSVRVQRSDTFDEEGEAFAEWVYGLVQVERQLPSSVCALFRTNAQSRALEEALLKQRIPYVVIGGTSFYDRKEVKDLLGYLRVAADRDDDDGDAVRRSLNAPFRFLGSAFVEKVWNSAGDDWNARVLAAAERAGIQKRQVASANEWVRLVTGAKAHVAEGRKPKEILDEIVHQTGYVRWLERDQGEESLETSHAANVREILRIAERFDTAVELLDYIDEMGAKAARSKRGGGERVLLMSVHRSKGAEFSHVWVSGCNENILPHAKGNPEEERRLMYVAITRARDSLVLSYVSKFAQREGVRPAQPSRFLRDVGLVP